MPWRLIFVVILMGVVVTFIGLNLENRADVSFGFYRFEQVPIFISLFAAFLAGVVVMIPFTFGFRRRRKEKARITEKLSKQQDKALPESGEESSGGIFKRGGKKRSDVKTGPEKNGPGEAPNR